VHQPDLAHGGTGLFFGEELGLLGVAQDSHPHAHRAGSDQNCFATAAPERHDLIHHPGELIGSEAAVFVGEKAGSHLHHHALHIRKQVGAEVGVHDLFP